MKQPDEKLRELNSQPSIPGPREEVYCTKIGTTHPEEMYIVAAHMDGIGWGEAANDDGSGTALVMELARIFSDPEVQTERSIRFALWNNEETGSERRARLRGPAQGSAGQGIARRFRQVSRAEMAGHDPARHDAVRPRHAAQGWLGEQRAARRGGRQYRIPGDLEIRRGGHAARTTNSRRRTKSTPRITRRTSVRT